MSEVKTELKIWGEEKEEKKELYLRLVRDGNDVMLIACNSSGSRQLSGNILAIKQNGVHPCWSAEDCLNKYGIPTDDKGRIKIVY
ncbi:MAG: hypothetical protein WC683_05455 [bacterium]